MAEQLTPNFGFSYYDQYDINWHTGLNNNFINLDALLLNIGAGPNFIPHTLFQRDSDGDGIPDLWKITSGSTYITGKVLQTSGLMGFAKKLVLTLNNSSGVTQYGIIECQNLIPPNTEIVFSSWLTSVTLKVKLRIYDGINNDGTYATYATAARVEKSHTLGVSVSSINLGIVVEIPTGTVNETVEIQLPMLNIGTKASAFCPAPGEVAQLDLPIQATMWHDESVILVGNTINNTIYTAHRYNFASFQSPASNGDSFKQDFTLKDGSYTLYILGRSTANAGKLDWYVDDVLQASGQDWYSASAVENIEKTVAITVSGNGLHTLKAIVNGKNASSTGYFLSLTKMWIK